MISGIIVYWYDMLIKFHIAINFGTAKKINCALMFILSNHCGRKCASNLLQLEPSIDMFKVISDIMAHWYEMLN